MNIVKLTAVLLVCWSVGGLNAQGDGGISSRTFQAIVLDSPEICRAWLLPHDEGTRQKRLLSRQIPCSYTEEMGLILLTGKMRFKEALTFEDLVKSQALNGLDLSYIALLEDELKSIVKIKTLRFLYLNGNKLTDAMIDLIAEMKQLETVSVFDCGVTKEQLHRLQTRLTRVKIEQHETNGLAASCGGYLHLELSK